MRRTTFSIDIPLPFDQHDPYVIAALAFLAVTIILLVILRRVMRRRKLAMMIHDDVRSQIPGQVSEEMRQMGELLSKHDFLLSINEMDIQNLQESGQKSEEALREIYRSQIAGMIGTILQEYAVQVRKLQEYENRLDTKLADARFAVSYIDEVERKSRVLDKHLADVWDLRRDITDVRKRVKDCSTLVKKAYADATKSQSIAKKLNSVCSFYDMLDRDGFWKPIEEFEGQRNRR